jgi:hypothetical protein
VHAERIAHHTRYYLFAPGSRTAQCKGVSCDSTTTMGRLDSFLMAKDCAPPIPQLQFECNRLKHYSSERFNCFHVTRCRSRTPLRSEGSPRFPQMIPLFEAPAHRSGIGGRGLKAVSTLLDELSSSAAAEADLFRGGVLWLGCCDRVEKRAARR